MNLKERTFTSLSRVSYGTLLFNLFLLKESYTWKLRRLYLHYLHKCSNIAYHHNLTVDIVLEKLLLEYKIIKCRQIHKDTIEFVSFGYIQVGLPM